MAPITPHIAEELWERMGEPYSIHLQPWPSYDEARARAALVTLVLQVDGKVRDRIQVPGTLSDVQAKELALRNEKVKKFMDGKQVADVVVVPGRLVNVVTK
jgi:leucyl-tRNA synthetase